MAENESLDLENPYGRRYWRSSKTMVIGRVVGTIGHGQAPVGAALIGRENDASA